MRKAYRWLKDLLGPESVQDLDLQAVASAFNDHEIRRIWLAEMFNEIVLINREIDKRLLAGKDTNLTDLCARRRALQDVLEGILSAKRRVVTPVPRHNPRPSVNEIDLDRVTA
jgi:hypothetical protein